MRIAPASARHRGPGMKVKSTGTLALIGAAVVLPPLAANAQEPDVYNLGEIHVTASTDRLQQFDQFGGAVVSNTQMATYGKDSLDKAVALVPGVNASTSGNQRNETNIYVHGFDRWQVPLSIDGIPIYLPADNRLDFSRFLTGDVSEVQIAKGYASVLDGPGAMGGWINLVTRKPSKPYEGELRTEVDFGNNGAYDGIKTYGRVGMRQPDYYLQASGTWRNMTGWELPGGFNATSVENGGRRDWSASRDWNANFKAGYTPNGTDEYSISFIRQEGVKHAPYNVDPTANNKYWSWPWWNVQTLSSATTTAIGDDSYVKTKLYWETFANAIDMYDNAAQTQQYSTSAEHSEYNDWALGGSVEAGHNFGTLDTLKAALHYRHDVHTEWNQYFVDQYGLNQASTVKSKTCLTSATVYYTCFGEPRQSDVLDTYSAALENTYHLTNNIDWVQGASYDYRTVSTADDYSLGQMNKGTYYPPSWIHYATPEMHAFNWQTAAIWRYSDTSKLYANVSDRTRFPTVFELYSSRFGTAASNPDLKPERAINFQLGWTTAFAPKSQFSVDVYYARILDLIQSLPTGQIYTDPITKKQSAITQNQNVGNGYRYGVDLSADYFVNDQLTVGGNLSAIKNDVTNPSVSNFQLTGIPGLKGMVYASYAPIEKLTLTPSVEFANTRWTSKTIGTTTTYFTTGAYVLANLSAEYQVHQNLSVSAGVRNIFDQNYYESWGYPSQGQNYFVAMKATF